MTASKYDIVSDGGGGGNGNSTIAGSTSGEVSMVTSTTSTATCAQTPATLSSGADIPASTQSIMLQQPNSPSSSSSTSKTNGDTTFEPTVDMMVNDFDDEQTLEEEEALAAQEAEDPSAELSSLQKESDMPIEELLALYNCSGSHVPPSALSPPARDSKKGSGNNGTNNVYNNQRTTNNKTGISESKLRKNISSKKDESSKENRSVAEEMILEEFDDEEEDEIKETSQLRELYPETYGSHDKRLLRTISRQQTDDDDDGDYSPDEDEFKKTIMVGSEFQAVIPEGFFKYDDALPYENEDKLLWDPSRIAEDDTEKYLQNAIQAKQQQNGNSNYMFAGVGSIPVGSHLRDDEQALYLLLQCGHNTDEALRRKRINAVPSSEQMTSWSEDECRNFESGIRIYGKDFHTIQHTKVRTRSVGELVQFYYLWKKTERHDIFANKARLEKKKYNLHPGLTDYMDRFLEEQEGGSNGSTINPNTNSGISMTLRDRSLSPGVQSASNVNSNSIPTSSISSMNSLIQADNKRNIPQGKHNSSTTVGSTVSSVDSTIQTSGISNQNMLKDPLALDDEEGVPAHDSHPAQSTQSRGYKNSSSTISTVFSPATALASIAISSSPTSVNVTSDFAQRTMNQ
ncbi:mesoderm induction early response protein 1 [Hermetia illucens]|uniref:mesoderm induction early response protein 1 n=1 Tax=Hermetia illucens TaxID=343691 RepID=UPI0018CBF4B4|nr:mesoderm induction early response protein 1 [Hermetia illucens]